MAKLDAYIDTAILITMIEDVGLARVLQSLSYAVEEMGSEDISIVDKLQALAALANS